MSSDLTLPAIPGLLRRGSPCFIGTGPNRNAATISQIIDAHGAEVTTVHREPHKRVSFCYTFQSLHLDLTDATGRAHAAWWLARREVPVGYHLDPAAVSWSRAPAQAACGWALHWLARAMSGGGSLTGSWWTGSHGSPVPTDLLADLDPDDPRLLPDGSRWVDAEALRRVVLHVAGVSP